MSRPPSTSIHASRPAPRAGMWTVLAVFLGGGVLADEALAQEPGGAPVEHRVQSGTQRPPSREATDRPDPGRLDPMSEVLEFEGVPVQVIEKRFPNGVLRSRIHVRRDRQEDGTFTEKPHGPQFHWHANRVLWLQRVYSNGAQNGPYREWSNTGLLQTLGDFRDDETHGTWLKYNDKGHLLRERHWEHGERVGEELNWYPSGTLRRRTRFEDGVKSGIQEFFHKTGDLAERGEVKADLRLGAWESWHVGGALASRGGYDEAGKKHGPWTEWDPQGTRTSEGEFEHGRRKGEWILTRPDEGLLFRETYVDGRVHGLSRCFRIDGATRVREVEYSEGLAHGAMRTWYEDGTTLRSDERFVRGKSQGPQHWFHPNGAIACEGTLEAGLREGVWRFFRADGTPDEVWSGTYRAGRRVDGAAD